MVPATSTSSQVSSSAALVLRVPQIRQGVLPELLPFCRELRQVSYTSLKTNVAGAGGFLENLVFGYGGLHYDTSGLSISASLPPWNVTEFTLRGVAYAGGTLRLAVNGTHQHLSRTSGPPVLVQGQLLATWPAETVLRLERIKVTTAAAATAAAAAATVAN